MAPRTTYELQGSSSVSAYVFSDPVFVTTPAFPVPAPDLPVANGTTPSDQTKPPDPPKPKAPGRASAAARGLKADRKGRVKVTLTCPAGGGDCAGTLALKQAKRALAPSRRYAITAGGRRVVTLTLSRKARRTLSHAKRARGLKVSLVIGGRATSLRLRR